MKFDATWKSDVREELLVWSRDVLSKRSEHFSGQPPCPFAFPAMKSGRVDVLFGNKEEVQRACSLWDDMEYDLIIVVPTDESWNGSDIEAWGESMNPELRKEDLALMAFVPDRPTCSGQSESEICNWTPLVEEEYPMVFIQSLSKLRIATEHLESKGYYKNCTLEFMEYVRNRSERN